MSAPTDPGPRKPSRRGTGRLDPLVARLRAFLATAPRRVITMVAVVLAVAVAGGAGAYALVSVSGPAETVIATDASAREDTAAGQAEPDEDVTEAVDPAVPDNPGGRKRQVVASGPAIEERPEPDAGQGDVDASDLARAAEKAASKPGRKRAPSCLTTPDSQLRVATYNIYGAGSRAGGGYDLGRVIGDIRAWDVDVAILQEVYRLGGDPARSDQPAQIAGALGMSWAFGYNVRKGPRTQYGTAIVSRYPIVEQANVRLPNAAGGEPRGLLRATVDVAGRKVDVFDTHLQHQPQYEGLRVAQARVVASQIAARRSATGNPAILGGDFNSSPTGSVARALQTVLGDTWFAVGAGGGATHPAGSPRARIDRLYQSDDVVPLGAAVRPSSGSDHNAVTALYEVTGVDDC